MASIKRFVNFLLTGVAALGLARPAQAVSDPRTIYCAKPYTLMLKNANGSIQVQDSPFSHPFMTLYQPGEACPLKGAREYTLGFTESPDGFFEFTLEFIPQDGGPSWSCHVKTSDKPPFITIDRTAWSAPDGAGRADTSTRPGDRIITLGVAPAAS